jgi:hypothetical protein
MSLQSIIATMIVGCGLSAIALAADLLRSLGRCECGACDASCLDQCAGDPKANGIVGQMKSVRVHGERNAA